MVKELPRITIRGVECYLDSRLNELRPVDNPYIHASLDDEDYPEDFKCLPGYEEPEEE